MEDIGLPALGKSVGVVAHVQHTEGEVVAHKSDRVAVQQLVGSNLVSLQCPTTVVLPRVRMVGKKVLIACNCYTVQMVKM